MLVLLSLVRRLQNYVYRFEVPSASQISWAECSLAPSHSHLHPLPICSPRQPPSTCSPIPSYPLPIPIPSSPDPVPPHPTPSPPLPSPPLPFPPLHSSSSLSDRSISHSPANMGPEWSSANERTFAPHVVDGLPDDLRQSVLASLGHRADSRSASTRCRGAAPPDDPATAPWSPLASSSPRRVQRRDGAHGSGRGRGSGQADLADLRPASTSSRWAGDEDALRLSQIDCGVLHQLPSPLRHAASDPASPRGTEPR